MNWTENWNPNLGLWSAAGPGHTVVTKNLERLHPGPNAATRLVVAAQKNELEQMDINRVLAALKTMQVTEPGDLCGCMKWYWEEDKPYDTNAAFFTGLSLIVLRIVWSSELQEQTRKILDEILQGLYTWFQHAVEKKTFYYPNKYLGDLVCAWLLLEIFDRVADDTLIANTMAEAATYWHNNGWGWGEHMSDVYASVCLDELSVLILLAKQLPDTLSQTYLNLLNNLLAIEDAYIGGPRVPALRSYAFLESRSHTHYRDQIHRWAEDESMGIGNRPLLGNLLNSLGWHNVVSPCQTSKSDIAIPCFGNTSAKACLTPVMRIGSVSRFPVMPSAEYPSWGLAWQSFPVAFSHQNGDWGFLQWETMENNTPRSHPAQGRHMAHQPKTLTETIHPPIVGQTHTIQRGSDLLVLRIMPTVASSWTQVTDRFRLTKCEAQISISKMNPFWHQLHLDYNNHAVCIHHLAFTPDLFPQQQKNDMGGFDWHITWPHPQPKRALVNLWAFSFVPIMELPNLKPVEYYFTPQAAEERTWVLQWQWLNTTWQVKINPRAAEPLVSL